jgi:hypothetical protein
MSLSWAGKIRSAFEGMVDATDAQARLAAAASLAGLRQQLADRQLEAQIENVQEPWRVPFALAPIAAPLWLADALVSLAQALQEAEEADHPDRPMVMTSLTHGQILTLLEPLDALTSDVAGVLADPRRHRTVSLPLLARPYSPDGTGLTTVNVPLPYVRGLLSGTVSSVGATQLLFAEYTSFLGHPQAPAWLARAFAAAQGDLAALQSRLDAVQGRSGPLLSRHPADEAALRDLALNLWNLTNTALGLGQRLASPLLFEGAQPLPPPRTPATQPATPARAQQAPSIPVPAPAPLTPPAPAPPTPPVAAPPVMPSPPPPSPVAERSVPMPRIEIAPEEGHDGPRVTAAPPDQPRPLPQIGGPASSMATPHAAPPVVTTAQPPARQVDRKDRWLLSSRAVRYRLRAAGEEDQAERQLGAFWEARGWSLSAAESRYLDEVQALLAGGAIILSGRSQADAPYPPIYSVVTGAVQILSHTLKPGTLFSYDYRVGGRGLLTDLSPKAGVPHNL